MAGQKRFIAAVVVTASLAAATLGLAAPVSAAPYVKAPALAVISTTPCKVTPFTVTGTDFVPESIVAFTMTPGNFSLGSVAVGANGGFRATITLPDVTGVHVLTASGPPTPRNTNVARATLTIRDCPAPTPSPVVPVVPVVPVTG